MQRATAFKGPVQVVSHSYLHHTIHHFFRFTYHSYLMRRSLELRTSSSASETAMPFQLAALKRASSIMCKTCILLLANSRRTFPPILGMCNWFYFLDYTEKANVRFDSHAMNQHISAPETYKKMLIFVKEVLSN